MNDAILRNMTDEELISYVKTMSLTTSLTEELAKRLEVSAYTIETLQQENDALDGQVWDLSCEISQFRGKVSNG